MMKSVKRKRNPNRIVPWSRVALIVAVWSVFLAIGVGYFVQPVNVTNMAMGGGLSAVSLFGYWTASRIGVRNLGEGAIIYSDSGVRVSKAEGPGRVCPSTVYGMWGVPMDGAVLTVEADGKAVRIRLEGAVSVLRVWPGHDRIIARRVSLIEKWINGGRDGLRAPVEGDRKILLCRSTTEKTNPKFKGN